MISRKVSRILSDGDTKLRCAFNKIRCVMAKDDLACSSTKEEVVREAEILCNDYVEDRLIRSGLNLKKRKIGSLGAIAEGESPSNDVTDAPLRMRSFSQTPNHKTSRSTETVDKRRYDVQAISKVLLYVGEVLELRHSSTYTDVLSQLNVPIMSEFQIKRAFNAVAREMFSVGISWAKIVSLFAFAGGLSVDCVMNGSNVLVTKIKAWTVAFISAELADWIRARGGWTNLVDHFAVGNKITFDFTAWIFLFACVLLALVICLLLITALQKR